MPPRTLYCIKYQLAGVYLSGKPHRLIRIQPISVPLQQEPINHTLFSVISTCIIATIEIKETASSRDHSIVHF